MVKITGILTWDGHERRCDRYGFITVTKHPYNGEKAGSALPSVDDPHALARLTNQRAGIKVRVLEARESGHIGDLFRVIFPSTPDVGTEFELGEGTLRCLPADWSGIGITFGLEPDDGRTSDWFDPNILYQLHDQTVEITIQSAVQ